MDVCANMKLKILLFFVSLYFLTVWKSHEFRLYSSRATDTMAGKFEYTLGINELKSKEFRLWQSLIGEFLGKCFYFIKFNHSFFHSFNVILFILGNLILNFFACGACTQPEDGTFKALAFGLGVFMAITVSKTLFIQVNCQQYMCFYVNHFPK